MAKAGVKVGQAMFEVPHLAKLQAGRAAPHTRICEQGIRQAIIPFLQNACQGSIPEPSKSFAPAPDFLSRFASAVYVVKI